MNSFDLPAHPAATEATGDGPTRPSSAPRGPKVRLITSEALFAEFPEVQIAHGDALYRLRQTSLGKLILTK
ncbi:MAG: hemin uptake protein HemP [Burkholderiaceae bacterium]|jgi:hemin uptake protein HemP